jgi:hypothetical protein
VPKLLRPLAAKALTAGKYLNVVRGCVGDKTGRPGSFSTSRASAKRVVLVTSTAADGGADSCAMRTGTGQVKTGARHGGSDERERGDDEQNTHRHSGSRDRERGSKVDDDVLVIRLPPERRLHLEREGNDTHSLARAVEEAHAFSSRALLRLLEQQYGLSGHLQSLRRFFLLEHGDFFIQFMDIAEEVSTQLSGDGLL